MDKSRTLVATAAGALTLTVVSPPQGPPPASRATTRPPVAGPADGVGVTNVSRVGMRLYISVGSSGAPAADFAIESLTAERSADGLPSVTLWGTKPTRPNCGRGRSRRSWDHIADRCTEPVRFVPDRALPAGSGEATVTSHHQAGS